MKITDLRCAVIGGHPIVRIVTDEGVDGYGQIEFSKPYVKSQVLFYRQFLLEEDPTAVERVMLKIRRLGAFKPWGSAVSAIEVALWDVAGKAAGVPIHRLLGGKIRDRVRVYHTSGLGYPDLEALRDGAEKFTVAKRACGYHGGALGEGPGLTYAEFDRHAGYHFNRGPLTERGWQSQVDRVYAMKAALGDGVGLAIDAGPGWALPDAIRFARAVESLHLVWIEDLLMGDYTPYAGSALYRDLTQSTSSPIHTGEQIYLRQNFMDLIEHRAVDVIGPDPLDVGGLAELKWIAEYADLHGILIAPHGIGDGILGLAALTQVCATLPQNFLAFEYPLVEPAWWWEIVQGLPAPIIQDGMVTVGDRPGLGVTWDRDAAVTHLLAEDEGFFD